MKNRILKVAVTIILIIAMTMSDFILVGMNLATYAQENRNDETNHDNVKFIVGFKTEEDLLSQTEYKIDDSEMKLYIKVSVENEGYFDGRIVLENSNFNIKQEQVSEYIDKIEGNTIILNRVRAGNVAEIEVNIEPIVEESYGEDMLSKESILKLTGEYKDNTEESIPIESQRKVTLNLLAPSNLQTSLGGRIITNKTYKIEGETKRIVQIEVNSEVVGNTYPIKATTFELGLPEEIEKVEVISKGTYATNGEADRKLNENSYEYNKENNTISVTIENTSKDGKISWKKDAVDNIIVTLVLSGDIALDDKEYAAKVKVEFYGKESRKEEKEAKYNLAKQAEGIISASIENKEDIYKGKIYSKEEREYKTTTNIEVNYANLVGASTLQETTIYRTETEDKQANIEYKLTKIQKSEIEKVLGQDGTIVIKNGDEEELSKITKDTPVDENGNVIIQYNAGVKQLRVEITNAVTTGVIRLNHTKVIKTEEYSQQEIQQLKNLVEEVTVKYNDEVKSKAEQNTELKDIKSEVALTVIPQTISAEESKQMQIALTLKTDKECYELFENPTFNLVMPEGVTISSLSEATISATNDEFTISKLEALNSREIRLEITGRQQKYVTSNINTQISFLANVEIERLMPNTAGTIKMQYTNKERTYELESKTINIIASNSKVVSHVELENYNGQGNVLERYSYDKSSVEGELPLENIEAIKVPVKYTIINNYDSSIEVIPIIVVRLTDKFGSAHTLLNYADPEVIVEAGTMKTIEKQFEIPAGLYYSEKIDVETQLEYNYSGTSYKLRNDINLATEEKQGLREVTVIDDKIQLETFVQLGDGTAAKENTQIYNEQIIEYIMEITNISNETISNVVLTNTQENGNIYDLKEVWVTDRVEEFIEHEYAELDTNIKRFEIGTLQSGESKELICRVVAKKTEQSNITSANISISAQGIEEKTVQKISNSVKDATIKISTKNALNDEVQMYSNDTLHVLTAIKNLTNEKIENVKIKKYMTEGLTYLENDTPEVMDIDENILNILGKVTYGEECVEYNITSLEANQEVMMLSSLHIKSLPLDKLETNERVYVVVNEVISNSFDIHVEQEETTIEVVQTSNTNSEEKLKNGDKVIVTAEVKNVGKINTTVTVEDNLPDGLEATKVELIRNNEVTDKTEETGRDQVSVISEINAGEKITVRIEAIVNTARIVDEEITNKIYATPSKGTEGVSNEIKIKIDLGEEPKEDDEPETEEPENPEIEQPQNPDPIPGKPGTSEPENPDVPTPDKPTPDDPTPDNPTPENPDDGKGEVEEPTYTISGDAWADLDGNNTKDSNEGIKYVTVKIIDVNDKNTFLKDKNGEEIEVRTDKNGAYKIEGIPKGKYNLIFKYDTSMYEIKTNTNVKDYIIESTKEKVAISNNINLTSNLTMNLQLEQLTEFDLKIDKYISKVIVQTSNGTKTTGYTNKQLVKEEIQSKYLTGATVLVEYTMQISNVGELVGYATEILDYLPKDMKFHSELNTQWYIGEDGNIYNTSLASSPINPGEAKTIKLVLVKEMNKNNTGTTSNIVEISDSMNIKEYTDINSNNNQSKAEIIVNPSTGTIIAYTIAILGGTAIVLMGVYIIKKKVIGKE